VHCFELYGLRTWLVAFWTYVAARHGTASLFDPITISVIVTVLITRDRVLMQRPARHIPQHHGKERNNCHQCDVTLAGHANPGKENRMAHGRIIPKHLVRRQSTSIPR
jgi:hypothetical protein